MKFHPSPELLLRYSAGTLSPAMSFIVASHVQQCPICQNAVKSLEYMGGTSIENYADSQMNDTGFDILLGRLGEEPGRTLQARSSAQRLMLPMVTIR